MNDAHAAGLSEDGFLERLRGIIREVGGPERAVAQLDWDSALLDSGIVDSVSVVAMAVKAEKAFGVSIAVAEFDPVNFTTPRAFYRMLARQKRGEPAR